MADNTPIEWADATVNAINGCSILSPGCIRCYAMKLAGTRLRNHPSREGLTDQTKTGPVWNGTVRLHEPALLQPLRWKRPRVIFWNAHGDTFHDAVPDEWIDRMFAVMALTPQHKHLVLTKRAARMRAYFDRTGDLDALARILNQMDAISPQGSRAFDRFPFPNVWLGVSVEDQARADERIPDLLATPAAGRFLSCEPLLGPVNLHKYLLGFPAGHPAACACGHGHGFCRCPNYGRVSPRCHHKDCDCPGFRKAEGSDGLHGIIVGGESGPGARPMHPDWARSLRDQCAAAGVDFHFKQWGEWLPWEPEQIPCWRSQSGETIDRHELPDFNDTSLKGWGDTLLYEGSDICVHQRVGKKAAGRALDGLNHDALPWHAPVEQGSEAA